jgi:NitT/TauT family transport system substrate-binding protein
MRNPHEDHSRDIAARAYRALVTTQNALKADVSLATEVGKRRFPQREAALIAGIVERDLPFYTAEISEHSFNAINDFARHMSILDEDLPYSDVVWRGER